MTTMEKWLFKHSKCLAWIESIKRDYEANNLRWPTEFELTRIKLGRIIEATNKEDVG